MVEILVPACCTCIYRHVFYFLLGLLSESEGDGRWRVQLCCLTGTSVPRGDRKLRVQVCNIRCSLYLVETGNYEHWEIRCTEFYRILGNILVLHDTDILVCMINIRNRGLDHINVVINTCPVTKEECYFMIVTYCKSRIFSENSILAL